MKLEKVFEEVNKRVSPSAAEAKAQKLFARQVIDKIQRKLGDKAVVTFVGSAARDTGLAGDNDIDIFAAFPKHLSEEEIVKTTFAATKSAVAAKWEMHYAEHPYLQTKIGEFKVEVIPCFRVERHEKIKSAVDRSPLHMTYLQDALTPEQRRDVRVLKKLLKANGIYGAESEVGGFSGLVCEQLMLNYRNLEQLLEAAGKWRPPVVVDMTDSWEAHLLEGKDRLASKFPNSPLILIDVIDRNRNAAASVSSESLARLSLLARALLAKPSLEWFFAKRKELGVAEVKKKIKQRDTGFAVVVFKKPDEVDDITFPQLRHSEKSIARHLELAGFELIGTSSDCFDKECIVLVETTQKQLAKLRKVMGPPIWIEEAVGRFVKSKKAARGPYLEGDHICIDELVAEKQLEVALGEVVRNKQAGLASHFAAGAKQAKVLGGAKLTKSKGAVKLASNYLSKFEPLV